ncbi:uncharacterized protein LOC115440527 [Manduca sexta]|uniref:uncharacterized protein LOC115440527 n=1 Tax=Manduca sexta TaxID=7130 RepID=UPI00188DF8BD|nr:uncharacterized protein LOC115440527 [Manduca sexta]
MMLIVLLASILAVESRIFCEVNKMPLEVGMWKSNLRHMDSAVVENTPVSISEGQVYVYENYFPGYIIRYIHVDNLATRSCGASATIRDGGIGSQTVLIVLHADTNQEIRSIIDIWGEKRPGMKMKVTRQPLDTEETKNLTSLYLFKDLRAVNHNKGF